jgi:serine/threonine-protein kinase HipA
VRRARVFVHGTPAGFLTEIERGRRFRFEYLPDYAGPPVSLTMPRTASRCDFEGFPPFFDGLLPEGLMLEALLRQRKIDRSDCFSQLIAVGGDLVGAVTVEDAGDEGAPDELRALATGPR